MDTCVLKMSGFVKADQCYGSGFRFTLCPIIPWLWLVQSVVRLFPEVDGRSEEREGFWSPGLCDGVVQLHIFICHSPVTISRAISCSAMSCMICTAAKEYISVPVKAASGVEVVCMSVSSSSEGSSTFLILVQRVWGFLLYFFSYNCSTVLELLTCLRWFHFTWIMQELFLFYLRWSTWKK